MFKITCTTTGAAGGVLRSDTLQATTEEGAEVFARLMALTHELEWGTCHVTTATEIQPNPITDDHEQDRADC